MRASLVAFSVFFAFGCLVQACKTTHEDGGPKPISSTAALSSASASAVVSAASASASVNPRASIEWPPNDQPIRTYEDPRFAQLPMPTKLSIEKANRPVGTLKSDTVFDAMKDTGLHLRHQMPAHQVAAAFCEKATTKKGCTVTVCEYHDPDKLAKTMDITKKGLRPTSDLFTVRNTMILIARSETPEAEEEAARLSKMIKKL